jgi:tol-pal system protein YbgF
MARPSFLAVGLLALAALSASPAHAQRVSLADRVSALERQATEQTGSAGQANVELLNRLTQLQSEVQALRGQVEQLQNDNAALRDGADNRYKDLDGRLQRIEGSPSPPGAVPGASAPPPRPSAPTSAGLVDRVPDPAASAPPPVAGDERTAYDSAFAALRAGDYVSSARGFKAYLDAFPGGALAPNAWYWLGESYYVTQNYPIALQSFETLLQRFPDSTKAPDALLKRGFSQLELGQAGPGQQSLNQVITQYPGSDAARLAASKLRTLSLQSR